MSQIVSQAFIANAKATVVMNRSLTEDESASIVAIKENAIVAGKQVSPYTQTVDPENNNVTRVTYFSEIATANAVVTAYLAFVPAPISAVAEAV